MQPFSSQSIWLVFTCQRVTLTDHNPVGQMTFYVKARSLILYAKALGATGSRWTAAQLKLQGAAHGLEDMRKELGATSPRRGTASRRRPEAGRDGRSKAAFGRPFFWVAPCPSPTLPRKRGRES